MMSNKNNNYQLSIKKLFIKIIRYKSVMGLYFGTSNFITDQAMR